MNTNLIIQSIQILAIDCVIEARSQGWNGNYPYTFTAEDMEYIVKSLKFRFGDDFLPSQDQWNQAGIYPLGRHYSRDFE